MVAAGGQTQQAAARIARIRVLKADVAAQMAARPGAADADARRVARMIALLDEAMEIARSRTGAEGQAMIDRLAVDIFRAIAASPAPGAARTGAAAGARGCRVARRESEG